MAVSSSEIRSATAPNSAMGTRFERFLAAVEPARAGRVLTYEPISGGYSRISARSTVEWGDGSRETFVLRGDPPTGQGVFVSDRDTEWRLMLALHADSTVATPVPRWYDADGSHLGSKCIVMDSSPGTSLQAVLATGDDGPRWRDVFIDTFAELHRTPLDLLPVEMERPHDWSEYIAGVIEIYDRVQRDIPDTAPVLSYVSDWMRHHLPRPTELTLVHGDCQPGNVLVGTDHAPLVIDWEFTHIGDPREDLGYYTQIPMPPNVYWDDPEYFAARYRETSGLSAELVNPASIEFFLLLGMAPLLAQCLAAADAVAAGQRPGVLATYLINAISHIYGMYLSTCDRLS